MAKTSEIFKELKRLVPLVLIGVLLTLTSYTIGMFFAGAEIFFLPVILILFLIGGSGLFTIPVGFYRFLRKLTINKWLSRFIGLAIGFYIGLLIQRPIDDWNQKQINISGQIVTAELEKFKQENGHYPDSLSQLNLNDLNKSLTYTYKIDRFNYILTERDYDLVIPVATLDRWKWNKDKKEFEYIHL